MLVVSSLLLGCVPAKKPTPPQLPTQVKLKLPEPRFDSNISLEETLLKWRPIRGYTGESLTFQEVSQLLWAAQRITEPKYGFRKSPSATDYPPTSVDFNIVYTSKFVNLTLWNWPWYTLRGPRKSRAFITLGSPHLARTIEKRPIGTLRVEKQFATSISLSSPSSLNLSIYYLGAA